MMRIADGRCSIASMGRCVDGWSLLHCIDGPLC
jgi:hypothetical protein